MTSSASNTYIPSITTLKPLELCISIHTLLKASGKSCHDILKTIVEGLASTVEHTLSPTPEDTDTARWAFREKVNAAEKTAEMIGEIEKIEASVKAARKAVEKKDFGEAEKTFREVEKIAGRKRRRDEGEARAVREGGNRERAT